MSRIDHYCATNRDSYLNRAALITPARNDWKQVYSRAAFAILSANTQFTLAVKALGYVNRNKGKVDRNLLVAYGMTPAKADWCNALPVGIGALSLNRQANETNHDHRLRLRRDVIGLGLCKASFLSALLEPLTADVACVDTHLQQVYLGNSRFQALSLASYLAVEDKIRRVARKHSVSTFLAQWMIWDHQRGKVEEHDIFPGSHK